MMKNPYRITSEFGAIEPVRSGAHTGIDLSMVTGTNLRSVVDGWITKVWSGNGTLGKGVTIKGIDGKEFIYGHMDSVSVKVGEAVKYGSEIGKSGNTGNSTGSHLHFAVKENGIYVDPSNYKGTLDKITGENFFANANTRESMENMEYLACEPNKDFVWYDVESKLQSAFDLEVCETKREIFVYLHSLFETTMELSYSVALIGGGILIILRVAGMTRATKYFSVLQVSYVLMRYLFGGMK